MSKKPKSAEIKRLQAVLSALNESPASIEEKTGISARTINNYIWGDAPLGGQLLRALAEQFGISVDWLITGRGEMFLESKPATKQPRFLVEFLNDMQPDSFQDQLWLMARCIEEAMVNGGACPGEDYSVVDLYGLAMPYALEKLRADKLDLLAHADA